MLIEFIQKVVSNLWVLCMGEKRVLTVYYMHRFITRARQQYKFYKQNRLIYNEPESWCAFYKKSIILKVLLAEFTTLSCVKTVLSFFQKWLLVKNYERENGCLSGS